MMKSTRNKIEGEIMNKENGWDASASWNGYMYQGKVALLVVLKKLNEVFDVTELWLESEGIEDFSIGKGGKYESVHQVKNRKDNKIQDYREALSNIVRRIKEHPNIVNGFLHTKNEIRIDNWEEEIKKQLLSYYPEKIQRLEEIVNNFNVQDVVYNEIIQMWNEKTKRINRRTNSIYKLFIDKMEKENNFDSKDDITREIFKSACEQVLIDEKANYDFTEKELAIEKIKLFRYTNGNSFADSSEIIDMTLEEIKKYWGEKAEYRMGKEEVYYMKLLQLINDNITERAEKGSKKIHIPLEDFKTVLDTDTTMICNSTKEEELLRLKLKYSTMKDEFCTNNICEAKSKKNCENCRLEEISNNILSSSLSQLEAIFRIMAIHKRKDLTKKGTELFSEGDLENSFFPGISEIDKEFFIKQCKVLCQIDDKFMMSTTIDAESAGRKRSTIEGLVQNDIQDICHKIMNNDEYDTTLMEVDKLITRNYDTENIFEEACKINLITEKDDKVEDKLKYMNITKTKKVGLISVKKAKEEYGERK